MQTGSVVSMSDNQLVCEVRMTREQKVHANFLRFRQRGYNDQIKHFMSLTIIPSAKGSIGQTREWMEAQIGPQTRTVELSINRRGSIRDVMDEMAASRTSHPNVTDARTRRSKVR